MKIVQLLNQPRDIPLALLLEKTCPHSIRNIINNAQSKDEFGWPKPKHLERCLTESETNNAKRLLKNVTECTKVETLKRELSGADICLSRGREYFIFNSPAKKNIALCFNRCYYGRFLDILPRYNGRLKILFFSPAWMSREYCGNFEMNNHTQHKKSKYDYDYAYQFKPHYLYANPFDYYWQYLKARGKEQVKKDIGLPPDRPIAFLSLRMSEKLFTIHDGRDEYVQTTIKMLTEFKEKGYYIISRRRMGRHDMVEAKATKKPEIYRYEEMAPYIDIEMNETTRFPGEIWEGLFASDVMLLSDVSGISYIEAALMRCPVYMPHRGSINNIDVLCPAVRDMFIDGLMMNEYNDATVTKWRGSIETFLGRWYADGGIKHFWQEVFK